jgi:peptidoglycan-associated lipoprotein
MVMSSSLKVIIALAAALSVSACSKKATSLEASAGLDGGAGAGLDGDGAGEGFDVGAKALPGSAKEFQTAAGDRVFFENAQSTLTAEAEETLLKQALWLKKYKNVTIQVEGHADERGTREYNISLSSRRATIVREFLMANGVSAARVATIAYGKEKPASVCDAEQCWSQNRRSVTVITGGDRTS